MNELNHKTELEEIIWELKLPLAQLFFVEHSEIFFHNSHLCKHVNVEDFRELINYIEQTKIQFNRNKINLIEVYFNIGRPLHIKIWYEEHLHYKTLVCIQYNLNRVFETNNICFTNQIQMTVEVLNF